MTMFWFIMPVTCTLVCIRQSVHMNHRTAPPPPFSPPPPPHRLTVQYNSNTQYFTSPKKELFITFLAAFLPSFLAQGSSSQVHSNLGDTTRPHA
ncbi:hypothetical protein L873DRAFT_1091992 [Choiromyces venosus 120613-1]|uniref:Secreted protein n=1 Tax=Choiromyces venosus 120613-1 TaxID=1336337 RepID=A0A3N4JHU7_9PEZI|nr:hypothetical protein L873DRAFT_1091992 [Choiromyces venosus 120613-1]